MTNRPHGTLAAMDASTVLPRAHRGTSLRASTGPGSLCTPTAAHAGVPEEPHPDFVQLVYTGIAVRRDTAPDGKDWSDEDGWEQSSDLVPWHELEADVLTLPFLELARSTPS